MLNILIQDATQWLASPIDERLLGVLRRAKHQEYSVPCFPYLAKQVMHLSEDKLNDFPYAAVYQLGDSSTLNNEPLTKSARLFMMTPVHFVLQRDHFTLGPLSWARLSESEAQALFETIKEHLSPDGYKLSVGKSGQWILETPLVLDVQTTVPQRVVFQDTSLFQPHGKQERELRSKLNEIQMLLFEHPVNIDRERLHRPIVNSVWLWGNGVADDSWGFSTTEFVQEHPYLNGLIKLLPNQDKPRWLVLDAKTMDADSSCLLSAIHNAKYHVNLHFDLGQQMLVSHIRSNDKFKFWRSLPAVFTDKSVSHD